MPVITVERKVLEKNDKVAETLRNLFRQKKIFVINMLSSPGSGKTSLAEALAHYSGKLFNMAVITGDPQTRNDAERIDKLGIPAIQIITNGACHLDASLVKNAAENIINLDINFLLIENVGNLVCPAGFDLGENQKVVVISVTEGVDKPLKYTKAVLNSETLIINKTDLLPYTDVDIEQLKKNALSINHNLEIFETSCRRDEGIDLVAEWIKRETDQL